MGTQTPEQLYGYEVMDTAGNKIGKVDGVWVDDATSELEFVGVKTGWLGGKTHIIPAAQAQIDGSGKTLTAPYAESQIKDAPSFETDAEFSPDDEERIYSHYGVDRSTAPSRSGLPEGGGDTRSYGTSGTIDRRTERGTNADYTTSDRTDTADDSVTLSEEELQVGKRQVESGRVRLRKVVRTEHVEQPVELRHEEVTVERIDATGRDVPDSAFQEQEINVPVMREEPVVGKEAHVTGQVRVDKTAETETQTVGGEIRKEDVEVDKDAETGIRDRRGDRS